MGESLLPMHAYSKLLCCFLHAKSWGTAKGWSDWLGEALQASAALHSNTQPYGSLHHDAELLPM